ncbi:MAG: discoidin domain-containing protein, partial [Clostridia bacterium]|nr:discoidin domain-containing protein [Clostridia bacterium]
MKKLISIALCLVMLMASVVALIPEMLTEANAATYRSAANGASSSYKSSKYYEHYTRIPLTGDGATDTLALALSQLGYHEGANTSDMAGDSGSSGNYTEYNYNMGNFGSGYTYDWCATFCSWALYQSRVTNQSSMNDWARYHIGDANYIWREVGCPSWVQNLKSVGKWKYSQYYGGSYKPKSGDLIFFRDAAHIGLVLYSDSSYVYTVEGNTSDASGIEPSGGGVYFKTYSLSNSGIDGYGVLPYKTDSSVKKIDYSGANPTAGLYISNSIKYVYSSSTSSTVSYNMPRFTLFEVTEIASNGRLKATYKTSSGTTVTGWVLNNSDRVIQVTSSAEPVNMTLKCVDDKGNTLKTQTITGNKGSTATITPPAIDGYACTQSSVSVTYVSGGTVTLVYKTILDAAIDNASGTRYCDYTPSALATLRSAYNEAVAVQKNTSATATQKTTAANKLNNAVADTIYKGESVVSVGASYTTSATERTDKWKDDGECLTDGVKNKLGIDEGYAGWAVGAEGGDVEIIVDLGATVSSNVYRIYTSVNSDWGINLPDKLTVSVSADKKTWTEVGSTDSETATVSNDVWQSYYMTIRTDAAQTARYVKFVVSAPSAHAWIEEVEVASSPLGAMGEIYVDGINTYVQPGKTVIFTPAFGTINGKTANHKWTLNIVAEWSSADNVYIVKSVSN